MKELRRKTFLTIFAILSMILILGLILYNLQNYNREREAIRRNLNIFNEGGMDRNRGDRKLMPPTVKEPGDPPEDKSEDPGRLEPEQMMIMDYEVYTVELTDGAVSRIISHGNASDDFDIQGIAETILREVPAGSEQIGNLYLAEYSCNRRGKDRIVIVNNAETAEGLRRILLVSLAVAVLLEVLLAFAASRVTEWIVRPARDSFQKQREFIADASHELKTPLAVIMASSEELSTKMRSSRDRDPGAESRTGSPDPRAGAINAGEGTEKLVDIILYEAERMSRLIAQLLTLSRLDEGVKTSYAEEDLSRIVEKTALAYEAVAYEQGVGIETDIQKPVRFTCNRDEMEKMIATILDNAVRHSDRDTSVRVELKESKGSILIRIVNRGDPIPEGDEERIFERFYRGDASRNRKDNRYGLGLAIAAGIARGHGGGIKARSFDGSTEFEIRLREK